MMERFKIFSSDAMINTIIADNAFVSEYCAANGYTFEKEIIDNSPPPALEERIAALEAENKLLKEQVSAQADQAEFYEDCIAEMATVVYA